MNKFQIYSNPFNWIIPLSLVIAITSCGGKKEVLGTATATRAPVVTSMTPSDNATGVQVHNPVISATFNEAVTGTNFVVSCTSPCTNPAGTLALDSTNKVATFTPEANLSAMTAYTVTVSATSIATALTTQSPAVWHFTTGAAPAAITITAVAPAANATNVALNTKIVSADFSEQIAPITGAASFTVTCAAPCTNPTGTVTRDATNRIAAFTLTPATQLEPTTVYTATVKGVTSLATGALLPTYVWQFTSGSIVDVTRPTVTLTVPATLNPAPSAPVNAAISATFSENIAPTSISPTSFTVTCVAPCVNPAGSLDYSVGTKTLVFTPDATLVANTTYTATVKSSVTDLAGNNLMGNQATPPAASDYVWTFITDAAPVVADDISVMSTNPTSNNMSVCPDATINATLDIPSGLRIAPASLNSSTFTVIEDTVAKTPVVAASVVTDVATGTVATFTPLNDLVIGTTYTATLKGGTNGVKDLAIPANTMADDEIWNFTVIDCEVMPEVLIPLGAAASFGTFGGSAGATNQGIYTVINGDIGTTAVSTALTGFHDQGVGCTYTETELNIGTVNGQIFTAPPAPTVACPTEGTSVTAAIADAARADALIAYNALVAKPAGSDAGAGNLANLVLVPGVYTAGAGSFKIEGGDLTLDAQGNANATWIFQMASTLTVGGPGAAAPQSVVLVNGAQAKNVFWQVGTAATINAGGGGTMMGTIISTAGTAVSTDGNVAVVTINGRVLSLNASVTLVNTVINVPAP
jgi:hypothetical protein